MSLFYLFLLGCFSCAWISVAHQIYKPFASVSVLCFSLTWIVSNSVVKIFAVPTCKCLVICVSRSSSTTHIYLFLLLAKKLTFFFLGTYSVAVNSTLFLLCFGILTQKFVKGVTSHRSFFQIGVAMLVQGLPQKRILQDSAFFHPGRTQAPTLE